MFCLIASFCPFSGGVPCPNVLGTTRAHSQSLLPSHCCSCSPEQPNWEDSTSELKRELEQSCILNDSLLGQGTALHLSDQHLQSCKQHGIGWEIRNVSVGREQSEFHLGSHYVSCSFWNRGIKVINL